MPTDNNLTTNFPPSISVSDPISSGIDFVGNMLGGFLDYKFGEKAADHQLDRQKELFDYQSSFNLPSAQFQRLIDAGLTPAAAAQAVSGQQQSQSMPSVSARPVMNSFDKIGDSVIDTKLKTSEILGNNANAQNTIVFGKFIQPLYRARINNIIKDTKLKSSSIGLNGSLRNYYSQLASQIEEQRPWQLENLILGLSNLSAMIDERLSNKKKLDQDTKTSKALEGLYSESTETERHKQTELDSEAARNYSESLNLDQEAFGLQWNNQLLAMDWNPSSSANENLKRLAFTDPAAAKKVIDNLLDTAKEGDRFLQDQFGENYKKKLKRLILAGGLHYASNKWIDTQLRRFGSFTGAIGNLVPFAMPSMPAEPIGSHPYKHW